MIYHISDTDKITVIKKVLNDIDDSVDIATFKQATLEVIDISMIRGEDITSKDDVVDTLADMIFSKIY